MLDRGGGEKLQPKRAGRGKAMIDAALGHDRFTERWHMAIPVCYFPIYNKARGQLRSTHIIITKQQQRSVV